MSRFMSDRGRQQVLAFVAAVAVGLGVVAAPQAATGGSVFQSAWRDGVRCAGVSSVLGAERRPADLRLSAGGGQAGEWLPGAVLRAPTAWSCTRRTPRLTPSCSGRVNDDVLKREGRDWLDIPAAGSGGHRLCRVRRDQHTVCGEFLRYWRSRAWISATQAPASRVAGAVGAATLPAADRENVRRLRGDDPALRARADGADTEPRPAVRCATRLGVELLPLHLKILAINDFHGQLSTGRRVAGKNVGGAAYLAAYIEQHRAQAQYSLTVHAGDMVGASEPVSALFKDQPTMEFLNMLGLSRHLGQP